MMLLPMPRYNMLHVIYLCNILWLELLTVCTVKIITESFTFDLVSVQFSPCFRAKWNKINVQHLSLWQVCQAAVFKAGLMSRLMPLGWTDFSQGYQTQHWIKENLWVQQLSCEGWARSVCPRWTDSTPAGGEGTQRETRTKDGLRFMFWFWWRALFFLCLISFPCYPLLSPPT